MRHSFSYLLARIVESTPGRFALGALAILGFVTSGAGWSVPPTVPPGERKNPIVSKHGPFTVRHFSGKCITFGSTAVDLVPAAQVQAQTTDAPVFLSRCANESFGPARAQTAYQHIVVAEINSRHEVILMAGNKLIGVAGNFLVAQAPLVLQDYDPGTIPAGQIFALDGDSIILAANRELVVEAKNGRGGNGTPLVLGNRDIEDAEFWDFMAVSGNYEKPTDGFVRVPQEKSLVAAVQDARWGDVLVVDGNFEYVLADAPPLEVQAGVTIRGDRRSTLLGPEIFANNVRDQEPPEGLFVVFGNNARITGMRLRGPTRDPNAEGPFANGIATFRFSEVPIKGLIVDHNDLSDWTVGAVAINGMDDSRTCDSVILRSFIDPQTRLLDVRIVRNFIHHNRKKSLGYGVVTGLGGFASIDSNTFLDNRHSIAADGRTYTGYSAWFNLVLSKATAYGGNYQQDFDMHGSNDGYGFPGGSGLEIVANTFLGTNRENLYIRGAPCGGEDDFRRNVVRNDAVDAIAWWVDGIDCRVGSLLPSCITNPPYGFPYWMDVADNHFESSNPTNRLGVGDFDGDGKDDLFLATGETWYFAPAGKAEWRHINTQSEKIGALRFGDFDGDGRTDVLTKSGRDWLVSWAGASKWEKINESDGSIDDVAIGDFDGDGKADIFFANGSQWLVSYGGVSQFVYYATSGFRVPNLRFGDFNGDRRTDVLGVVSGQWMAVYGGTETWQPLPVSLTDSVEGLIVADFNGNGRADIARSIPFGSDHFWEVSYGGVGNWQPLRTASVALGSAVGIGRFDDANGADVLLWNGNILDIASAGRTSSVRHSRQDMR
jgi:hypothetical protein